MSRRLDEYRAFLRRKCQLSAESGYNVGLEEIHPFLKPHQKAAVQWAVRGGRRALFESFGLGKTVQQLEILRLILARTGGRGLIVAPLGVRQEFARDAGRLDTGIRFIRCIEEADAPGIYLTNYETVRDGKLDPSHFAVASLDEAAVLRGLGGSKTFREFMRLFATVPYRFVATATPDPNEYIELLAYSEFLGVMDVGQAKTRFFKRDSTKADRLTLHPHKEEAFWLWVASWALFLEDPSDLGFDNAGYVLPPMQVLYHEVAVDHSKAGVEVNGQHQIFREATKGVVDAAREKRETLPERIAVMQKILAADSDEHCLIWHDLEREREAIEATIPGVVTVYGSQDLDERERAVIDFSEGRIQYLAGKPVMLGSGPNFQYHCASAIFLGIGFKFSEFLQAIKRIHRFLQTRTVTIHIIYAESERLVLENLQAKWRRYDERAQRMREIIRQYGLSQAAMSNALARSMGIERRELIGDGYTLINNDAVEELLDGKPRIEEDSVGLILTSIPFATQYEYTPSYSDFGHSENNDQFFEQMDFLTPELLRVLQPGRIAAVHVKDRIVPGGINKLGFQTIYPFHAETIRHFQKHGFAYMGMKTIVTDVVRENNQTYRLGWTEQCKDGSKMGCGMPEYLLLFRKPPSDNTRSYADLPVVKEKSHYSRSRWQIDAHGFSRSSGNRLLSPADLDGLPHEAIFKLFREFSLSQVYDFEQHVSLSQSLERCIACGHIHIGTKKCGQCECVTNTGILPVTFMLLQPQSWHPDVWSDITRMLSLNSAQSAKGKELHLCPMQFDIADRVIEQFSMPGELVLDPFGGLGTVAYRSILKGRRAYSIELSAQYWLDSTAYCKFAESQRAAPSLFDLDALQFEKGALSAARAPGRWPTTSRDRLQQREEQ